MVLSLGSHCFIHLLYTFSLSLPFFPVFCTHSLLFSFSHTAFRLEAKKGISARLQLVSVLQHHANHGRGKMMVGGKKIWFRPNLATCCGSLPVSYCAPRADLASSSFPLLHLHHSLHVMCECEYMCVFLYIWGLSVREDIDGNVNVSVTSFHSCAFVYSIGLFYWHGYGHHSVLSFLPTQITA